MAEFLPILDERVFSEQELSGCKEGVCCQCGMCCIAYRVNVPGELGNVNSPLITKLAGERCPQLVEGSRGQLLCLLHDHKDHPALEVCMGWGGNKRKWLTDNLAYDDLHENVANWLMFPRSTEQVDSIRERLQRGAISNEVRKHCAHFFTNPRNLILLLRRYVMDLKVLPHDIFSFIGLPEHIQSRANEMPFILADIGFTEDHPLYREFLEMYLSRLTEP